MSLILLVLGCGRGAQPSDSQVTSPPTDVIQLDPTGLPDCANSISDTSFCNGWAWTYAGQSYIPDWLRVARDPGGFLSTTFQEEGEFLCADDAVTAEAILQAVFPQDERYLSGVDESDPRWLDIHYDDTGTAFKVFRVPRCAVFTSFANVGRLWPGSGVPRIIDPLWELTSPPADRTDFFDTARMLELYRYGESDAYFDTSVLWAIGTTASETTWTLRTCRIDGRSTGTSDGRYRTGIWQTEYRMDIATGRSTFQAEDVRGVMCDHWLGADPPW